MVVAAGPRDPLRHAAARRALLRPRRSGGGRARAAAVRARASRRSSRCSSCSRRPSSRTGGTGSGRRRSAGSGPASACRIRTGSTAGVGREADVSFLWHYTRRDAPALGQRVLQPQRRHRLHRRRPRPADGGLPETPGARGARRHAADRGRAAAARRATPSRTSTSRASVVARDPRHRPDALPRERADGRADARRRGLYPNDTWGGRLVLYRRVRCDGGVLSVKLGTDEKLFDRDQVVTATEAGRVVARRRASPPTGAAACCACRCTRTATASATSVHDAPVLRVPAHVQSGQHRHALARRPLLRLRLPRREDRLRREPALARADRREQLHPRHPRRPRRGRGRARPQIVAFAPTSPAGQARHPRGARRHRRRAAARRAARRARRGAAPGRSLGHPAAERWLGAFDALHFSDWMYPPQRSGRARDDDPRPRAAAPSRSGRRGRTRSMHGRKYRNAARTCDVSSPTRRSPPTTSPPRSGSRASASSSPTRASAPSSRRRARRPSSAAPYAAHGGDARAAQEPGHARRGVPARRRPRPLARRRGRSRLGRPARARPARASCGSAASPTPSWRASTAARRSSSTRRGSRASACRSPRRWRRARPSSRRRTRRWTRRAAARPCAPTRRARRRSPTAIREALARRDELRALGLAHARALLVAARRRGLPRGVRAIRVAIDTTPLLQTRAGTARYVRGAARPPRRRGRRAQLPGDVAAPHARGRRALVSAPAAADGGRRPPLPDLPRARSARAHRSSSRCTISPCSPIRSGSTAGRRTYSRFAVPRVVRGRGARDRRLGVHEARARRAARRAARRRSASCRTRSRTSSRRTARAAEGDYVLAVGTLEPRKNLARIAEAVDGELRVVGAPRLGRRRSLPPQRHAGSAPSPDEELAAPLPRCALPRLRLALRGLRDPGRRGARLRLPGRHERAARRWRSSPATTRPTSTRTDVDVDPRRHRAGVQAGAARGSPPGPRSPRRRAPSTKSSRDRRRRRRARPPPDGRGDLRAQPAARAARGRRPTCASPRSRATRSSCPTASRRSSCPPAPRSCAWRGRCRGSCGGCGRELAHFQHALPLGFSRPRGRHAARPSLRVRPRRDGPPRPADVQGGRAARRAPRPAGARRLGAHEAGRDRALRAAAGEDHGHPARRRPRVHAGEGPGGRGGYLLFVGAVQARKDPLAALAAAQARRPAAGRRRAREGAGARARPARRAAPTCGASSSKPELARALPRRRRAHPAVPLRGLRPAGARGDGLRHAGRRCAASRRCARSAATRSSTPRTATMRRAVRARARRPRAAGRRRASSARARFTWAETARRTADGLPEGARVKVAAVVVSHGHPRELERLAAGAAAPGRRARRDREHPGLGARRASTRSHNDAPLGFAANVNKGVALTTGELVVSANPDAVPAPTAPSRRCAPFMEAHPRCGIAGPQMLFPDGTPQPSRRRFPTVDGHDRAADAASPRRRRSGITSISTRRVPSEPGRGRLDARRLPDAAPRDARGARRLRRGLPPLRRGHRPRLPRDAGGLGAVVRPRTRSSGTSTRRRPTSAG